MLTINSKVKNSGIDYAKKPLKPQKDMILTGGNWHLGKYEVGKEPFSPKIKLSLNSLDDDDDFAAKPCLYK